MPRAGASDDIFWIAQDYPAELTFPQGFTAVLAARLTGINAKFETIIGQPKFGTPMITDKEGRLSHGITKRFTPISQALGSSATALPGPAAGQFELIATVVTTQDNPHPLTYARQNLAKPILHNHRSRHQVPGSSRDALSSLTVRHRMRSYLPHNAPLKIK